MTEKDLQNRILRILYFRYRDGKSGQVKKIIDLSMSHNNATDIKSAYSDLIEMVVPY